MLISEICDYLNNYFDMNDDHEALPSWRGEFSISDGEIDLTGKILNGQYFRIQNSIFNDGVHQYPATDLTDETFTGKIQAMAIPKDLIAIAGEIEEWMTKNAAVDSTAMSPFNSESFAGYAYSKSSGGASSGTSGNAPIWAAAYGGRLARWRKL